MPKIILRFNSAQKMGRGGNNMKKIIWYIVSSAIFIGYKIDVLRAEVLLRLATYGQVDCNKCANSDNLLTVRGKINWDTNTEVICQAGTVLSGCWSNADKDPRYYYMTDSAADGFIMSQRCTYATANCIKCPTPGTCDSSVRISAQQKASITLCSYHAFSGRAEVYLFNNGNCYITTYVAYVDNTGWDRQYMSDCYIKAGQTISDNTGDYIFNANCYY